MSGTLPQVAYDLTRTVVLVGMMGSGKTAIGTNLARVIGVPMLDSDQEIEAAANSTIAEIFARDGEPFFRDKESQVIARLLDGPPAVLSTGGGAFLAERNRKLIHDKGVSVCLSATPELLWSRVKHKTTRPLLQVDDPRAALQRIYDERAPLYALADLEVETKAAYSIGETTEKVIERLLEAGILKEKR